MVAVAIRIPDEWDDNTIVLFEEFCSMADASQITIERWVADGVGPRWWRINGDGRRYTTASEVRRLQSRGV